MYYIRQKNDILVVAMQKISLATIFIREVNNFILISDLEYKLNQTSLSYKKITIRFCCFCLTATVVRFMIHDPQFFSSKTERKNITKPTFSRF